jgi:hypothetical protein
MRRSFCDAAETGMPIYFRTFPEAKPFLAIDGGVTSPSNQIQQ